MIRDPQPGEWVHMTNCGHVHGFVVGPVNGRNDIFDMYSPYPNVGWRRLKIPTWCMELPKHPYDDADWAKYAAFMLTGEE